MYTYHVLMVYNTLHQFTLDLPILHLGQSQFLPIQLQESIQSQVNGVFCLQIPCFEQPGDLIHSSQFDPCHPRLHLNENFEYYI